MEMLNNRPAYKPTETKQPNKYELQLLQAIKQGEIMSRVNKETNLKLMNTIK